MRIILESFQDVENYLRSPDLYDKIVDNFGKSPDDSQGVCDFIVGDVLENLDTALQVSNVIVCKVVGEEVDTIDTSHPVINYNGYYYDYTPEQYNDSFNGMIGSENIPIVQPMIKSDAQINERISTVKGYVMLGGN